MSHNSGDITSRSFRGPAIKCAGPPREIKERQDPSLRCQPCFKIRRICDQALSKCTPCSVYGNACVPQVDQQLPTNLSDLDNEYYRGFLSQILCDQVGPQRGNCEERKRACKSKQPEETTQGFQDPRVNQRLPTTYEDLECCNCYIERLLCDQGRPKCGNCQGRNRPCDYPIDISNLPEDIRQGFQDARDNQPPPITGKHLDERCRNCFYERSLCDQDQPQCGNCQQRNFVCDYNIQKGHSKPTKEVTQGFQDAVDNYHNNFKLDYRCDGNSLCSSGIEGRHVHYRNEALPIRENASVPPPQKSHVTEDLLAGIACII